jgi:hypothetical protein
MVFNATFNNISVISFLLVEETRVPGENHQLENSIEGSLMAKYVSK